MLTIMVDIIIHCANPLLTDNLKRLLDHENMLTAHAFTFDENTANPDHLLTISYTDPASQTTNTQAFKAPIRLGKVIDAIANIIEQFDHSFTFTVGKARYVVDHQNLIKADGQTVKITPTEKRIIKNLLNANNQAISRTDLLTSVWGYRPDLDTHTAETHIYRLRQKIETDPSAPLLIKTQDQGYIIEQDQ